MEISGVGGVTHDHPMVIHLKKNIQKTKIIYVNDVNPVAMLRFLLTLNSTRASWSTVVEKVD